MTGWRGMNRGVGERRTQENVNYEESLRRRKARRMKTEIEQTLGFDNN